MTSTALAGLMGVNLSRISELEAGKTARYETYEKAARALGFKGGLTELMASRDSLTDQMLRAWLALPTDDLRRSVLRLATELAAGPAARASREDEPSNPGPTPAPARTQQPKRR